MGFAQGESSDYSVYWSKDIEYKALAFYFNIHQIPCVISSPFRRDSSPSLSITSGSSGKIHWVDFGTGETGNFKLLMAKTWGTTIKEAEKRLLSELSRITAHEQSVKVTYTATPKGVVSFSSEVTIEVRVRDWKPWDLEYWESYGINKEWLEFGDIYPISHIFINKPTGTIVIPAEKYAYVFVEFKDNKPTLKIYQPFSKLYKWRNTHDRSVWDLWSKLPGKGDRLIITSSRKDALCIWANTGIPSVSLQGEGYIPKAHVVSELLLRFRTVYVLYDNDFRSEINYGREFGKKLAETFGLKQIEIPTELRSKDPSDLYHNHGREKLQQTIIGLITNQKIGEDECPF